MIANRDIMRVVLLDRRTIQPLTKEFYAPCVAELVASDLFECVFLEDDEYGNDFFCRGGNKRRLLRVQKETVDLAMVSVPRPRDSAWIDL